MLTTKSVCGMPELFSTTSVAMLAGNLRNVEISREAGNQDGDARGEYEQTYLQPFCVLLGYFFDMCNYKVYMQLTCDSSYQRMVCIKLLGVLFYIAHSLYFVHLCVRLATDTRSRLRVTVFLLNFLFLHFCFLLLLPFSDHCKY